MLIKGETDVGTAKRNLKKVPVNGTVAMSTQLVGLKAADCVEFNRMDKPPEPLVTPVAMVAVPHSTLTVALAIGNGTSAVGVIGR